MGSGIRSVTQVPTWLYQRYSHLWKRVLLSAGWAVLFLLLDSAVAAQVDGGALPVQWRLVLAAFILIAGLWHPAIAYAVFVAAVIYPLSLVSVYVMALALAVLILTSPLVVRHMPLALMVLGAPVLAPFHLTPVLPLLFGLWASAEPMGRWGTVAATAAGGLCALWLKVVAGMSGQALDLWQVNGLALDVAYAYERFHTANSLQTLVRLVEPLAAHQEGSAAMTVLFHVLQVFAWAGATYLVAAVRDMLLVRGLGHSGRGNAWTSMLSLVPGILMIWAGYVLVPSWLQVPGPRWMDPMWLPAQVVLAGGVALGLDGLLWYLQRPLHVQPRSVAVSVPRGGAQRRRERATVASGQAGVDRRTQARRERTGEPARVVGEPPEAESKAGPGDDIIMIELD